MPLSPEQARGLRTARARLGLDDNERDRRERAEALAEGLISLRRAVERGTLV